MSELFVVSVEMEVVLSFAREIVAGKQTEYYTAIDIGGSGTRVQLLIIEADKQVKASQRWKFPSTRIATFTAELQQLEAALIEIGLNPSSGACVAGAGPVEMDNGGIDITNYEVGDSMLRLKDIPAHLCPPDKTSFINDLEATAYGIVSIQSRGAFSDIFSCLEGHEVSPIPQPIALVHANYLVVAVGTGLGIASLLYLGEKEKRHLVMPMEFGHVSVVHAKEEDKGLLDSLSEQLYDGKHVIEYEDMVSGPGLARIYDYYYREGGYEKDSSIPAPPQSPGLIAERAVQDPPCALSKKAMEVHYTYLMRHLKNLAIGLRMHGIILAGNNVLHNALFLQQMAPALRAEFNDHSKAIWLRDIPMIMQKQPINLNLAGAAYVAQMRN